MLEKSRVTRRAETGGLWAERSAGKSADRDRDRGPGGFVGRHALVSYHALAYFVSWLVWLPYVLSQHGLGVLEIAFPEVLGTAQLAGVLPGAYLGPLGAAFVVTAIAEGRPGLRRWRGRLFRFGVGWRWYALALIGVPAVLVAGTLALPGAAAGLSFPPLEALLFFVPMLLIQMVTTGLAEEPGWRDFALPRHQRLQGPLAGTLILGVLWAGWHLPLFLTEWGRGIGGANLGPILLFVAFAVVVSIVITWIFNNTRESLPLAVLFHAGINTFASVMFVSVFTTVSAAWFPLLGGLIGFSVVALVLVVATRGRLGYRPEPHADAPSKVV
jgi:membrane protease YdiL (CAAX protease family)